MAKNTTSGTNAIELAINQIEKDFGKGAIMKMGDSLKLNLEVISTGSILLDSALGVGGLPKGRIVEIFGPESSGKTTVSLHIVAEAQKKGGVCAFIDAEHALDPKYASNIGVDTKELLISQPDHGEQALEITETLVRSGAVDVIVVDSVAALVPKAELEGDMGDSHIGLQARLMSQALRKLTAVVSKSSTIVIFVNQLREKVGVMFGNPEVTPGGKALKFYASIRLDVRKKESIKKGEDIIGTLTKVKVVKNKVAPPFKEAIIEIIYGKGISKVGEILSLSVDNNLIEKFGSWYSYNSEKIGQGKDNAIVFLENNPEIMSKLESQLVEIYSIKKI
ncbi:MAG: recombinase RecA [Candidatus Margulisbacteria bacterium GWF2_35_9]|nr:MAG: recombinase RecA [Candidatus Margulisbacteria bacterium GWF2_35_9]